MLNYDGDSLEDDTMVTPGLHLTASTHEFNFHLPLNTERVRPESGEHDYQNPTISVDRITPSASAPVSNLQRIFITSDENRDDISDDNPDLSQISFVTDALNDVFHTDFNFKDKETEREVSGKGRSHQIKSSANRNKSSAEASSTQNCDAKNIPTEQEKGKYKECKCNKYASRQQILSSTDDPSSEDILSDVDVESHQIFCTKGTTKKRERKIKKVLINNDGAVAESDINIDSVDDVDDYALNTESETDDYKVSQRAAQGQVFASSSSSSLDTENKSDDDKGAMISARISNPNLDQVDRCDNEIIPTTSQNSAMTESVEEKSEKELTEKALDNLKLEEEPESSKDHSDNLCNCDNSSDKNDCSPGDGNLVQIIKDGSPSVSGVNSSVPTTQSSNMSNLEVPVVRRIKYNVSPNRSSNNSPSINDYDWDRERYVCSVC